MACGRSVAARAKLFYQHNRAVPSLSRVHSNDDDHENPKPKRPTPSYHGTTPNYSHGSLLWGRNDFRKFHRSRSLFQDWRFMAPAACGTISVRNMSSTGEGSADKIGIMSEVIDDHTDNAVELVSQAYSMSLEVAEAAVDSFYPVGGFMYFIDYVHISTGLSWWSTIAGVTLLIRLLHVPFTIHVMKSTSKFDLLQPQLLELREEMQKRDMSPAAVAEGKAKKNKLLKQHGISALTPVKGILVSGPILCSFLFAIKNMAEKVPSFKEGGTLWFTDLTTPDTLYIFPVLTALTFWITVELNALEDMEGNPNTGFMKKVCRIFAVLAVPITANYSKAIFCCWITSNLFSLAYGIVMKKPKVRKWLDIPDIPGRPPPSNGVNSEFSITGVIKEYVADQQKFGATESQLSSAPPAEESTKLVTQRTPGSGSSVLSQRIKILEKEVEGRKKEKKN